jgi:hypothetical protein
MPQTLGFPSVVPPGLNQRLTMPRVSSSNRLLYLGKPPTLRGVFVERNRCSSGLDRWRVWRDGAGAFNDPLVSGGRELWAADIFHQTIVETRVMLAILHFHLFPNSTLCSDIHSVASLSLFTIEKETGSGLMEHANTCQYTLKAAADAVEHAMLHVESPDCSHSEGTTATLQTKK